MTLLHLGSEKTDGIDHSWARPLAREGIALRLLVQLLAIAPETADGNALLCNATVPPVEDTLLREVDLRQLSEKAQLVSSWSPCAWRALRSSKLALAVACIPNNDH